MTTVEHDVMVRAMTAADRPSVLALLQESLGWKRDERHAAFFAWKHEQSPFGVSPAWVAVDRDGELLGFRTFLRWEFMYGATVVRAVRAVDTATRPDAQRRGIFSLLTTTAIETLISDDVEFIFNTPNAQSLPGYVRMGWRRIGRLPVSVRAASVSRLARLARARGPAQKWSLPTQAGTSAIDAFVDGKPVHRLVTGLKLTKGLHTRLSVDYLRWRYGFPNLRYRVLTASSSVEDGVVVFRVRRRGRAVEAVICDVLVPFHDREVGAQLCRQVLAVTGADYAIRTRRSHSVAGFLPLPSQGPVVTWLALTSPAAPSLPEWDLSLGDVELF